MSLIEGIGDEVTIGFSIFALLCFILLAWFSTHTRDIPFVSIIVVELSQRRGRRSVGEAAPTTSTNNSGEESHTLQEANSDSDVTNVGSGDGVNNNAESNEGEEPIPAGSAGSDANNATPRLNVLPEKHSSSSIPATHQDSRIINLPDILSSNPSVLTASDNQSGEYQHVPSTSDNSAETAGTNETVTPFDSENVPAANSSDEVRRKRVAYFENAKDKGSSERRNSDVSSLGAESEKMSVGASSGHFHCQTNGVSGQSDSLTGECVTVNAEKAEDPSMSYFPLVEKITTASTSTPPSNETPLPVDPEGITPEYRQVKTEQADPGAAENTEPANDGQQIRVRLKYLNDTQRLVYADPLETVGNFRQLHFSSELQDNKIVRFIFNGQDLRNDLSTLRAYNVADNSVIHCLITQSRQNEQTSHSHHAEDDETQMGEFLYPVFGLILGLVWYLRFSYKQYFNVMSTVSLAGVSFIYLLALFSSLRHRRQPHQHLD